MKAIARYRYKIFKHPRFTSSSSIQGPTNLFSWVGPPIMLSPLCPAVRVTLICTPVNELTISQDRVCDVRPPLICAATIQLRLCGHRVWLLFQRFCRYIFRSVWPYHHPSRSTEKNLCRKKKWTWIQYFIQGSLQRRCFLPPCTTCDWQWCLVHWRYT